MNKQIVALVVLLFSQVAFGGYFSTNWRTETDKTQADVCYDYIERTDMRKAENRIALGNALAGAFSLAGVFSIASGISQCDLGFKIFNASTKEIEIAALASALCSVVGLIAGIELIRNGERIKQNLERFKAKLAKQTPEKVEEVRKENELYEQKVKHEQENVALNNELLKLKVAKQKRSA